MQELILGVDEAGRGPLAGPVAVGFVMVPEEFDIRLFEGVRDSKQMSEIGREIWFERARILEREYGLKHRVVFSSAGLIDKIGIARAVRRAVHIGVRSLARPNGVHVLLDGLLTAPKEYKQTTIVGGDQSEPIISLASILAKVRRDRLMKKFACQFPHYNFEQHKGYGTKKHIAAIGKYGLCSLHRKTFCKIDEYSK